MNYELNSLPLVSVIVTTFNRADLLSETLDSILNQTYTNFELIIVDDGSTDNTEEIVKKYAGSHLQYVKTDNWGGPARPRNIGIKQSKGKYIAFCDDDDLWLPDKLERQINYLYKSNSGMIFTMQKQFGATSILSNYYGIVPLPFRVNTITSGLLKKNCIPLSSAMVKKTIIDQVGYFDERKSYIAIEDNDMWIRISKIAKIHFIPMVLVLHRVHKENIYENTFRINHNLQHMKSSHGYNYKWSLMLLIKNNKFYYFIRNIINKLYEIIFLST